MIDIEELLGPERVGWFRMTVQERWAATNELWRVYSYLGGSLEEEPHQNPGFDEALWQQCFRAAWQRGAEGVQETAQSLIPGFPKVYDEQ